MSKLPLVCIFAVLVLTATPIHAGLILGGTLDGPFLGNLSAGTGAGSVSVDDSFNMSVNLNWGGLEGAATGASLSAGGFFALNIAFPADTSGSVSGTFVIDSGVYSALVSNSGIFRVDFNGGAIGGQVLLIAETAPDVGGAPPGPIVAPPQPPLLEAPEPATFLVVLFGLGVLAFRKRISGMY
jgi:hypothetical protein